MVGLAGVTALRLCVVLASQFSLPLNLLKFYDISYHPFSLLNCGSFVQGSVLSATSKTRCYFNA